MWPVWFCDPFLRNGEQQLMFSDPINLRCVCGRLVLVYCSLLTWTFNPFLLTILTISTSATMAYQWNTCVAFAVLPDTSSEQLTMPRGKYSAAVDLCGLIFKCLAKYFVLRKVHLKSCELVAEFKWHAHVTVNEHYRSGSSDFSCKVRQKRQSHRSLVQQG